MIRFDRFAFQKSGRWFLKSESQTRSGDNMPQKIEQSNIAPMMRQAFIDYSMSVITDRALPDVRDGLKPVHRRILYAMHELGMTPDSPSRKSARIVGEVLGKYHPHGDTAVYEAMVLMGQDFSTRYPTVQGQGNFGSIDGDGAAAMRYTEAKLSNIAMEMLRDINKDTVDFMDNFDGSEVEPRVLPARIPHLLVNGTSGIAVGMATKIPPHNLGEVVDAVCALVDDPTLGSKDLLRYIKGPDFPTSAQIIRSSGLEQMYETGKGSFVVRAKAEIKDRNIIITEIPYKVNKAKVVETIGQLVREKTIQGITDIRDETSLKTGIRVVIRTKKSANPTLILNQLFKHTDLQCNFSANFLALAPGADGKLQPKVMTLRDTLDYYIDHQKEVLTRRTKFDLEKARKREHILAGLIRALDLIDQIIADIRSSRSGAQAKKKLKENYDFTDVQAQAILDMRLQRLTGLEREKLEKEYRQVVREIKKLEGILAKPAKLNQLLKDELQEIREKYADPRRTQLISESKVPELSEIDTIEKRQGYIKLTRAGYIGFSTKSDFTVSGRSDDEGIDMVTCTTHDRLLLVTDAGNAYSLDAHQIPEIKGRMNGVACANLVKLNPEENPIQILVLDNPTGNLVFTTQKGRVKRMLPETYTSHRRGSLIKIKKGDLLVSAGIYPENGEIVLIRSDGYALKMRISEINSQGKTGTGTTGTKLSKNASVLKGTPFNKGRTFKAVTENGATHEGAFNTLRLSKPGLKGSRLFSISKQTGPIIGLQEIMASSKDLITPKVVETNLKSSNDSQGSEEQTSFLI